MEFLNSLIENGDYAILTAFVLGLMTAISPCPLATNISAIGFISRDIADRRRVFISGIIYTLGRGFSYTALGALLFFGMSKVQVTDIFQGWGEKLLGPVMILMGLFMLDLIRIKLPGGKGFSERFGERSKKNYFGTFMLGVVFALAFCPYSGFLYFGMLIPLSISSVGGLFLPLVFAIATGLPVIIFAWLLAYAVGNVGKLYNGLRTFEKWFRRVVAILFIGVGIYFVIIFFF